MKPLAVQTNGVWRVRRLLAALFAVMSLCLSGIATAPAAVLVTYFQNDAAGTPVVATSATGTVIWRETHQPYGVRHTQQATVTSYPLQFTGHAEDPDTGMVYTGARMYDPSLARFTGADPAPIEPANPRSFTRYGYGNNNPYRNVDPDGESPIDIAFLAADTLKLSLAIYSGNAAAIQSATIAEAASLVGVFNPFPFSGQALKAAVFASKIRAAEKGIAGVEKAAKGVAGETKFTSAGRRAHNEEPLPPGFEREVPIPGTKLRMDGYNRETKQIVEIKPDNLRSIRRGNRQLEKYCDACDKSVLGDGHTTVPVQTYDQSKYVK